MIACPSAQALESFVADKLGPTDAATIEAHLAACAMCQELADRLSDDDYLRQKYDGCRERLPTTALSCPPERRERWYAICQLPTEALADDATLEDDHQPPMRDDLPRQLGRFHLERELGRGGLGIVYLAYDPKLRRKVALKTPHSDALCNVRMRYRFLREMQATAALHHPHIAGVLEAGEVGDVCYLVSPYCPGGTLADYLAALNEPMPPCQAALLVSLLADAAHYAHERGVLHRDIKPQNVLLETMPVDTAQGKLPFHPRLIDFGLARFLEAASEGPGEDQPAIEAITQTGMILGTPRYMAPEQAEGRPAAVTRAADVYALGAVLYELITGRPPFEAPSRPELLRKILLDEVDAPRRHGPHIPRDLEAICLKCLEKRPDRRFASAEALAADLRRFLKGEPTDARPLGLWQRAARWTRSHPVMALGMAGGLLAVVAIVVGLCLHLARISAYARAMEAAAGREQALAREADRQGRLAREREVAARQHAYAGEIARNWRMWQLGHRTELCDWLNRLRPMPGREDFRDFGWYYLWGLATNVTDLGGHTETIYNLKFAPDSSHCAGWCDEVIYVWDCNRRTVRSKMQCAGYIHDLAFSTDGRQITSVSGFGRIEVWDVISGRKLSSASGPALQVPGSTPYSIVTFAPNAEEFAYTSVSAADGQQINVLHLWNLESGASRPLASLGGPICKVARYSLDGTMLAASHQTILEDNCGVEIIDTATGQLIKRSPEFYAGPVWTMAFTPDRQTLIIGTYRGFVIAWPWRTDEFHRHLVAPDTVAIESDVSRQGIAVRGLNSPSEVPHTEEVVLWRGTPWAALGKPPGDGKRIHAVAFSADGDTLAYSGDDRLVRLWNVRQFKEFEELAAHEEEAWCVAFSPSAGLLASGSDDHTVRLWDVETGAEKALLAGHTSLVADCEFSSDGLTLATSSFDRSIKLWDVDSRRELHTLTGHEGPIRALAFDAAGKLLASGSDDQTIKLWDVTTGQLRHTLVTHQDKIRAIVFYNQSMFFSADNDGVIRLWDAGNGRALKSWRHVSEIQSLALNPTAKMLAAGSKEGTIRLYSLPELDLIDQLEGLERSARALAFSVDGRTLASGGEDTSVTLWHVRTGQQLFNLPGVGAQVNGLAFSADGATLAAATHDGKVILWRAPVK